MSKKILKRELTPIVGNICVNDKHSYMSTMIWMRNITTAILGVVLTVGTKLIEICCWKCVGCETINKTNIHNPVGVQDKFYIVFLLLSVIDE